MREIDREITQPIYTGSLNPELHPVPRTTIGFSTNNQSQITKIQHHKEVILIPQEHSPSLPFTQP